MFITSDDSLEESLGLLSALRGMTGMVPPPSSLDWSVSNSIAMTNFEQNESEKKDFHEEPNTSTLFSTPSC